MKTAILKKIFLASWVLSFTHGLHAIEKSVPLVFLVHLDAYASEAEGLGDLKIIQTALDSVEPFHKYSAAVNFQLIPFSAERLCSKNKAGPKDVLACGPTLLNKVNSQKIEHFKLIVLSKEDFVPNAKVARGKNSAIFLPTIFPNATPEEGRKLLGHFFLHELGHAFGLRDEYGRDRNKSGIVDAELASLPSNNLAYQASRPNCAPDLKTAKEWWGEYVGIEGTGYYSGCAGNMKYVRPSEDKLMSAYAKDISYGYVSENYLDQVISCFYLADDSKPCRKFRKTYPKFWQE